MRWLLAFSLTSFAAFLVVALTFGIFVRGNNPDPPWTRDSVGDHYINVVDCSKGQPLEPFRCGDRIDQHKLVLPKIVSYWQMPQQSGLVSYADAHKNGRFAEIQALAKGEDLRYKLWDAADVLNKILLMSLGVLIIAKGRKPLAYPAGLFLYGLAAGTGIRPSLVGLPYWLVIGAHTIRQAFVAISLYALFLLVIELTSQAIPKHLQRILRISGAILNFGLVFPMMLYGSIVVPLSFRLESDAFWVIFYILPLAAKLIPLGILAYGLTRPTITDIGLLRWIFAATVFGFSGPIVKEISSALLLHDSSLAPLVLTESVMAFGYGYALIRHRLVDVNFVLNRAAVLATVGVIVAVAFLIVDHAVTKYQVLLEDNAALGETVGLAMYVAVIGLGWSLQFIEPRIDALFDRVAYGKRYRIQRGLDTLVEDCAKVERADDLAHIMANQLRRLTNVQSVAIYELGGDRYFLSCVDPAKSDTRRGQPAALDKDDQVILRMGARFSAVEASALATALRPSSVAFPMAAGGRLIGVVVCDGHADYRPFDPDERRLIERFVCEIGSMLLFLRSQYYETRVHGSLVPAMSPHVSTTQ